MPDLNYPSVEDLHKNAGKGESAILRLYITCLFPVYLLPIVFGKLNHLPVQRQCSTKGTLKIVMAISTFLEEKS